MQVMEAQRRVQLAKESVIHRQRIANQKESDAALQMQKAEALAAAARQEANAAATSVVLAQQRLAQAKSEVAEQQRVAAEKEAHAAAVIHKSASAAAVEIQRKGTISSGNGVIFNNQCVCRGHRYEVGGPSEVANSGRFEARLRLQGRPTYGH